LKEWSTSLFSLCRWCQRRNIHHYVSTVTGSESPWHVPKRKGLEGGIKYTWRVEQQKNQYEFATYSVI
jgi:hypothetical protein